MTRLGKRLVFWGGITAAVALVGAASFPVVSGRTSAPVYVKSGAEDALVRARRAQAMKWAPDAWTDAQSKLHAALAETRRQEVRFFFFRNFDPAREQLRGAEAAAVAAREQAIAVREESRAAAREAIDRAAEIVDNTARLTGSIRIDPGSRRALRESKLSLSEAQLLWEAEAYAKAQDHAEKALDRARRARGLVAALAARYADRGELRRWRSWKQDTIQASRRSGGAAIVIDKDQHELTLYVAGRAVRTYRAELGFNHLQRKLRSGDGATPEGRYRVIARKDRGRSKYHRALELNYPNDEDRQRFHLARRRGEIPAGARPGGLIEIHGDGGRGWDWTRGCVALSNRDIDDLFPRISLGTPVTIIGSDGGNGRFAALAQSLDDDEESGVSRLD